MELAEHRLAIQGFGKGVVMYIMYVYIYRRTREKRIRMIAANSIYTLRVRQELERVSNEKQDDGKQREVL